MGSGKEVVRSLYVSKIGDVDEVCKVLVKLQKADVEVAARVFRGVTCGTIGNGFELTSYLHDCIDRDFVPWVVIRRG